MKAPSPFRLCRVEKNQRREDWSQTTCASPMLGPENGCTRAATVPFLL
jgi:hypothetical protein